MASSKSSVASVLDENDLYHTQDSTTTAKNSNKIVNENELNAAEAVSATYINEENSKNRRIEERKIFMAYKKIPSLEITKLPRGGISLETEAVGRIQVS